MLWKLPKNIDRSNAPLWRYMSFSAYVRLLQTNSLFFSRLDRFGDPSEGSLTENLKRRITTDRKLFIQKLLKNRQQLEIFFGVQLPDDVVAWPRLSKLREKRYAREIEAISSLYETRSNEVQFVEDISRIHNECEEQALLPNLLSKWRRCFKSEIYQWQLSCLSIYEDLNSYANCWTRNENESFAMWNLYCRDNMGVAVCTTAERFIDILERHSGDGNWKGKVGYNSH